MILVTCALIRNEENEILVVQRGDNSDHPFKWEFPGGKIKEEETEEECIIREIKEELSMDIVICSRMQQVNYNYVKKHITLVPFICDTLDDIPFLTEHIAYRWINTDELKNIDFSEADILVAQEYAKINDLAEPSLKNVTESYSQTCNEEDLKSMINNTMGIRDVEWIVTSAIENEEILRKLIEYSFTDEKKLGFRSSWILTKVFDKFPELLASDLPLMVESLEELKNESVQRSFLRIISLSDLNPLSIKQHGILADHCFRMLRSGFSAIAIKAYSMEIIFKLALIYPELANELSVSINMLQDDGSAGILARGRMILKKLAEIPKNRV